MVEAKFDVLETIRLAEVMHNVCGIYTCINLLTCSMEQSHSGEADRY